MSEENNIPRLPTQLDQMREEIQPYLLDPREDYPEPYYMLEYNGTPFSTLGGLQAITGQKKNGKSFVLTQLMAAILGYNIPKTQQYLPGLTVPARTIEHLGHEPKVLYVDTEMEKLNSAKVLRRVHWLCGIDMKYPDPRFHVLWMRSVKKDEVTGEQAWKKRYRLIKYALEVLEPDIVFIDGLRDIIGTINEEESTVGLLSELASIAEDRHICIWLALHQNPSNDEHTKMRGWSGTELGNKVSDTLVSIKKKEAGGKVVFTVKQQDARGKDIDDWQFQVTDDAGMLGIPKIQGNALAQVLEGIEKTEQLMVDETVRILKTIIMPPQAEYFTAIIKKLKEGLHCGEKKAKEYFNAVRQQYPLLMYQKNDGRFMIDSKEAKAYAEHLPFAPPD